jgi:hypothetical protein
MEAPELQVFKELMAQPEPLVSKAIRVLPEPLGLQEIMARLAQLVRLV